MERDKKRGIDEFPPWIVGTYYDLYGKEASGVDRESYTRAVLQNGSISLIESMRDRLHNDHYSEMDIDEFNDRSGFDNWRDELPGSFSNWARGVGEVLTEVGSGVLEVGAAITNHWANTDWEKRRSDRLEFLRKQFPDAKIPDPVMGGYVEKKTVKKVSDDLHKYAQKAREADLGQQQSYQITSPDEFWERISAGNVGEAVGWAVHEGSKSLVPFMTGMMISPVSTGIIMLAYYTGNDARERQDIFDQIHGTDTAQLPMQAIKDVLPTTSLQVMADMVGYAAITKGLQVPEKLAKYALNQKSASYKSLSRTYNNIKRNPVAKVVGGGSVGAVGEAITEGTQEGLSYWGARRGIPNYEIDTEELAERIELGAIIGGLTGGAAALVVGGAKETMGQKKVKTEEDDGDENVKKDEEVSGDEEVKLKAESEGDATAKQSEYVSELKGKLADLGVDKEVLDKSFVSKNEQDSFDRTIDKIAELKRGKEPGNSDERLNLSKTARAIVLEGLGIKEATREQQATIAQAVEEIISNKEIEIEVEPEGKELVGEAIEKARSLNMPPIVTGYDVQALLSDKRASTTNPPTAETDSLGALVLWKESQNPNIKRELLPVDKLDQQYYPHAMVAPRGAASPYPAILERLEDGKYKAYPIGNTKATKQEGLDLVFDPLAEDAPLVFNAKSTDISPDVFQFVDKVRSAYATLEKNPDSDVAQNNYSKLQNDPVVKQLPNKFKDEFTEFDIAVEKKKKAEAEAEKKAKEDEAKAKEEAKQKEKAEAEKEKEAAPKAAEKETKAEPEAKEAKEAKAEETEPKAAIEGEVIPSSHEALKAKGEIKLDKNGRPLVSNFEEAIDAIEQGYNEIQPTSRDVINNIRSRFKKDVTHGGDGYLQVDSYAEYVLSDMVGIDEVQAPAHVMKIVMQKQTERLNRVRLENQRKKELETKKKETAEEPQSQVSKILDALDKKEKEKNLPFKIDKRTGAAVVKNYDEALLAVENGYELITGKHAEKIKEKIKRDPEKNRTPVKSEAEKELAEMLGFWNVEVNPKRAAEVQKIWDDAEPEIQKRTEKKKKYIKKIEDKINKKQETKPAEKAEPKPEAKPEKPEPIEPTEPPKIERGSIMSLIKDMEDEGDIAGIRQIARRTDADFRDEMRHYVAIKKIDISKIDEATNKHLNNKLREMKASRKYAQDTMDRLGAKYSAKRAYVRRQIEEFGMANFNKGDLKEGQIVKDEYFRDSVVVDIDLDEDTDAEIVQIVKTSDLQTKRDLISSLESEKEARIYDDIEDLKNDLEEGFASAPDGTRYDKGDYQTEKEIKALLREHNEEAESWNDEVFENETEEYRSVEIDGEELYYHENDTRKYRTVTKHDYHDETFAEFEPLTAETTQKLYDFTNSNEVGDEIEIDGETWTYQFFSPPNPRFYDSGIGSNYFINSTEKKVIRISDHWSSADTGSHNVKEVNFLKSVWWEIKKPTHQNEIIVNWENWRDGKRNGGLCLCWHGIFF